MTAASKEECPAVELAPGYTVSRVITGCWQLASDHGAASPRRRRLWERWRRAIEEGYTTFDCADIYTGVEELLGGFLAEHDAAGRARIHTKLVPDRADLPTLRRADVERAVDRSLRRLGRERLDLVQLQWWDFGVPGWIEAASWLDDLRRRGKVRLVGLTNFDRERVAEIVAAGVEIAALQVQYSVLDRRPEGGLAAWCRERGLALLAYGTLGGGFLSARYLGRPAPEEAPENRSLVKYRLIVEELGGWEVLQRVLAILDATGRRHGASPSLAAVRWALDRSGVAAAIVGVSRRDRLSELRRLWSPSWSREGWEELSDLLARHPGPAGSVYGLERQPGGPHEAILRMDLHRGGVDRGRKEDSRCDA